jgi:hypothetical protein
VALQEHRAEVFGAPAAWLPWNDPTNLAPPSASWRQSSAMPACCGWPFHSTMANARADRRALASWVVGHQVKRPCERRFVHNQEPCPSEQRICSVVPARFRKTESAPLRGWSPSARRQTAASPSMPLRKSTGSVATKMRLCGVSWSMRESPKRSAPGPPRAVAARRSESAAGCHRHGGVRSPSPRGGSATWGERSLPQNPGRWMLG